MGLHFIKFTSVLVLLAYISISKVNPQNQECSLTGIDLIHCLNPSTATPISLDTCCTTLNQAVQAGYNCVCSLLGSTNYPSLSIVVTLSFSNCYIAIPPLTHCHDHVPEIAPPVAEVPGPTEPLPSRGLPKLMPPDLPGDDSFVPLPPKVNEIPLNSTDDDSSTGDIEPEISISPLPKLSIPERWSHMTSDCANANKLVNPRILLILAICACIA